VGAKYVYGHTPEFSNEQLLAIKEAHLLILPRKFLLCGII
jgi:hypothetical protein